MGAVKLYDVLQQRALLTLFPPSKHLSTCAISAAVWSSARPCVFAVAMEMGGVYIYDFLQSKQEPVMQLSLGATSGSQQVTSLVFNPKQRGLLAVGDVTGRVLSFGCRSHCRSSRRARWRRFPPSWATTAVEQHLLGHLETPAHRALKGLALMRCRRGTETAVMLHG